MLCEILLFLKAGLIRINVINDPFAIASVVNSNLIFGFLNFLSLSDDGGVASPDYTFMSPREQQSLTPLLTVEGCQFNHWFLTLKLLVSPDMTNFWTFLVLPQKAFALGVDDLLVPHEQIIIWITVLMQMLGKTKWLTQLCLSLAALNTVQILLNWSSH